MCENTTAPIAFGSTFTDHMLKVEYDAKLNRWKNQRITSMENLSLHPAAKVLQYAATIFEGMKAYRGIDNKIRLFRPLLNMQRLNTSAERACLPTIDPLVLLKYMEKLIRIDESFVPSKKDTSLYIRPTIIGTDPTVDLHASKSALLYVIMSPNGPYFGDDFKPIRLYANPRYVRAWIGGYGQYKLGANYGPAMFAQKEAQKHDCQQVLWLYGDDEQLTEVGAMTLFFYYINEKGENELRTPPLNGLILPGITRQSILELAREWNEFKVIEQNITMSELLRMNDEKRLLEVFCAGTACVVCPVGEIFYRGTIIALPKIEAQNKVHDRSKIASASESQSLCSRFYKVHTDICYGRVSHPWAYEIRSENDDDI